MTSTRTPQQIIGNDAYLQLVFEGFAVVPAHSNAMETLAAWMIANGFATGHGDTVDDLLQELRWQISDRVGGESEACAKVADDYARRAFLGPHGSDVAGVAAEHIAASIRKRANYDSAPTDPHHGGKIWNQS